jgi:hypothetical protein
VPARRLRRAPPRRRCRSRPPRPPLPRARRHGRKLAASGLRGASLRPRLACRAASSTSPIRRPAAPPPASKHAAADPTVGRLGKGMAQWAKLRKRSFPSGTTLESAFLGRGRIASRVKPFFCPVWHSFAREAVPNNTPYIHGLCSLRCVCTAVAVAMADVAMAMLVKKITW